MMIFKLMMRQIIDVDMLQTYAVFSAGLLLLLNYTFVIHINGLTRALDGLIVHGIFSSD